MKNLYQISNKVWILISVFVSISLFFLVFLFQYKIETILETDIIVKPNLSVSVLVNSDIAYKIQYQNLIRLKIDSHYYDSLINSIKYNSQYDKFEVKLLKIKKDLIPNSSLKAYIIQDIKPIIYFLVGV